MATSIHSNNNDISNDEVYARNLQREELHRIQEEMRKKRKDQLRNQISSLMDIETTTSSTTTTTNNINDEDDNDIIIIDDDDDNVDQVLNDQRPSTSSNFNLSNRTNNVNNSIQEINIPEDTNMDEEIAKRLQEEFDRELASSISQNSLNHQSRSNNINQDNTYNLRLRANSNINNDFRSRNEQSRIPNSFETDLLYSIARDRNRRISNDNQTSSVRLNRSNNNNNNTDPVNNLAAAFNFLNNRQFMEEFLADDNPRITSNRNTTSYRYNSNLNQNNTQNNTNNSNTNRNLNILIQQGQNLRNYTTRNNNNNNANLDLYGQRRGRGRGNTNSLINLFQFSSNDRDFNSNDYESLLRLDEINGVKKCLNKHEIDSLPTFEFKSNMESSEENTCSICYDEYSKKDMLTALACSHKFHKKCIKQWLQQSRQCPLCKKDAVNGE